MFEIVVTQSVGTLMAIRMDSGRVFKQIHNQIPEFFLDLFRIFLCVELELLLDFLGKSTLVDLIDLLYSIQLRRILRPIEDLKMLLFLLEMFETTAMTGSLFHSY